MSRRENERKASLDKLGKIASSGMPPPPPAPRPAPAPPRAAPTRPPPVPKRTPASAVTAAREKQLVERREKLAEERALKDRRAGELARSSGLPWRGMDNMGVPASIRRTGFDRDEPSVAQKIHDVLGEKREKDGRAKARDKGKRQRG